MEHDIDEFERLLKNRDGDINHHVVDEIKQSQPERLVAERSASIDDFILMLSKIVCKVMKKQKVEFKPDEGIRLTADQAEALDHPFITFRILDSYPKLELKPRIRQFGLKGIDGQDKEKRRSGEIWGQVFSYTVQFDILAGSYQETTDIMNNFKDVIFTYTAHFKKNGVKDIRFARRLTDSNLDIYRQKSSVRSLQYNLEIEELYTRLNANIEGIDII